MFGLFIADIVMNFESIRRYDNTGMPEKLEHHVLPGQWSGRVLASTFRVLTLLRICQQFTAGIFCHI